MSDGSEASAVISAAFPTRFVPDGKRHHLSLAQASRIPHNYTRNSLQLHFIDHMHVHRTVSTSGFRRACQHELCEYMSSLLVSILYQYMDRSSSFTQSSNVLNRSLISRLFSRGHSISSRARPALTFRQRPDRAPSTCSIYCALILILVAAYRLSPFHPLRLSFALQLSLTYSPELPSHTLLGSST